MSGYWVELLGLFIVVVCITGAVLVSIRLWILKR